MESLTRSTNTRARPTAFRDRSGDRTRICGAACRASLDVTLSIDAECTVGPPVRGRSLDRHDRQMIFVRGLAELLALVLNAVVVIIASRAVGPAAFGTFAVAATLGQIGIIAVNAASRRSVRKRSRT